VENTVIVPGVIASAVSHVLELSGGADFTGAAEPGPSSGVDAFVFFRRSAGPLSEAAPARDGAEMRITAAPTAAIAQASSSQSLVPEGAETALDPPAFTPLPSDPFAQVDHLRYSTPVFADITGDGILDLVVGSGDGLYFYEGLGDGTFGASSIGNPFAEILVGGHAAANFIDLDNDGDLDLVVAALDGQITAYRNGLFGNDAGFANLFEITTNDPFQGVSAGLALAPAFNDLDGDGDLDMVIGNSVGELTVFRNGTNGVAGYFNAWDGVNPLGAVSVPNGATPTWVDLDGDGDSDLVVGTRDGDIFAFRNGGDGWRGAFRAWGQDDPFAEINVELRSAPTFTDLDGDGDLDLVTGSGELGLFAYENLSSAASSFAFDANATLDLL